MDEVLKALLGAAMGGSSPQAQPAPSVQPSQAEANPMADLIGGILGGMGGAETPVSPQAQPSGGSGNGIADLIGSLIGGGGGGGGGQQSSGNGIADLIGSIMGGGSGMNAQGIHPMAELLAEKTGLSPMLAQAVVAFFLAKMMEFVGQRFMGGGTQPALPQGAPQEAAPQSGGGFDLDHLLSNINDEEAVNLHLSNSGMAQELSSQTGLDEATATQSLQTLVMLVGEQKQQAQSAPAQSGGLDNLLDSWD